MPFHPEGSRCRKVPLVSVATEPPEFEKVRVAPEIPAPKELITIPATRWSDTAVVPVSRSVTVTVVVGRPTAARDRVVVPTEVSVSGLAESWRG